MRIAVLGPLEVRANDSAPVYVPGARERLLLAILASGAPGVVASDRMIEALGDGDDIESLRAALRRLRGDLEPGLPERASGQYVLRRGPGYLLAVGRGDVDAVRFGDLAARGRVLLAADDVSEAVRLLTTALGLWRGDPYGDWPDVPFARAERDRLAAVRAGVESDLTLARTARPVEVPRPVVPPRPAPRPRRPVYAATVPAVAPEVVQALVEGNAPVEDAALVEDPVAPGPAPSPVPAPGGTRFAAARVPRTAMLVGGLVVALAAALVVARVSAANDQQAQQAAALSNADRLAALAPTEGALDVSLLLAAQAFRLADSPGTRRALTTTLDGHERVERAASFDGVPVDPVLSGGRTLTFGVGSSVVGWSIGPRTTTRILMPIPGDWGAWLVSAPSPVEDVVLAAGIARDGPWVRSVSALDGTSRLLLQGDQVGGRPVDGAVSSDGRRLLLLVAEPDGAGPTPATRWRLLDLDSTDATRRDTGIEGTFPGPVEALRADFADDGGSFVVWSDTDATTAVLVQVADGRQVPLPTSPRRGRSIGFRAFPGGAVQLWDDGLFLVLDRNGATLQSINYHQRPVQDVAVSPDGRWAVTAGAGSEVFLWDIDPVSARWYGPELLRGHTADVVGVEIDPAGTFLATVSLDRTAITWDVSQERPDRNLADPRARLLRACAIAGRDFTAAEWFRFLPDRPWQPTCSDLS